MSQISRKAQHLQRCQSSNDFKTRKLTRSNTLGGKLLEPISTMTKKTQYIPSQGLKACRNIKLARAETAEVLSKLEDKENNNMKIGNTINRLGLTGGRGADSEGKLDLTGGLRNLLRQNIMDEVKKEEEEEHKDASMISVCSKKTKSTRILTKKLSSNLTAGLGKPNQILLDRITCGSCKPKLSRNLGSSKLHFAEYQSVPEKVTKQQNENQKQLIECLSPIKKSNRIKGAEVSISGQSLLAGIDEREDNIAIRKPAPFSEGEQKMPKIMKRYLPKDFFLRG